jgi:pimeloyl-ACP methyl ester carboxylesterase
MFTSQHPDEVAGLMLIDASPATWPATACAVADWKPLCDVFHDPSLDAERLDVFPAFDAVAAISSLGDLPMTVMPRAHYTYPGLEQQVLTRLDAAWAEGAEQWASLSSDSTVVPVQDTGHLIQLEERGLVIDEVEKLLARAAEPVDGGSGRMGR